MGIPEERQSNIFKPFQNIQQSREANSTSTGVELYVASELCKLMGGSIKFTSATGKGTTFDISLDIK